VPGRVSAKAVIVNSDGKFLVLTNSYMDIKPHLAYAPDFPGGTLEPGESSEQAMIREVKEELGIDLTAAPRKALGQCGSPLLGFSVTMYLVWANVRDVNLGEEHCMFSWRTLDEMKRMRWWGGYKGLLQKIEHHLMDGSGIEYAEYTEAISYA